VPSVLQRVTHVEKQRCVDEVNASSSNENAGPKAGVRSR
jgi:hypothetical protein